MWLPPEDGSWTSLLQSQETFLDLAAVAQIATMLMPGRFYEGLEESIDVLRRSLMAEAFEIFLADPGSHEMFLAVQRGQHPGAFCQRLRFAVGDGFPGLIAAYGRPLSTRELPCDPRFLRTAVKARGFQCYVGVPLWGGEDGQVVGALQVAWKRPDAPLDRALRLLSWVSVPISTALLAAMYQYRADVKLHAVPSGQGACLDDLLLGLVGRMQHVAGAAGGRVTLFQGPADAPALQVATTAGPRCPTLEENRAGDCPCLREGRLQVLRGPRSEWLRPCRSLSEALPCMTCIPVTLGGQARGVVSIWNAARAPWPPTRHLAPLLAMLDEGVLQLGRNAIERVGRGSEPPQAGGLPVPAGASEPHSPSKFPAIGPVHDRSPDRLKVRCFGPFELCWEGRLIPADMFRRSKALVLLKILLVRAGKPIGREALNEMLWPDGDAQGGTNRLNGVVHALREVIEPYLAERRWLFVLTQKDQYFFSRRSPHQVDLYAFEDHVQKGLRGERIEGDAREAARHLEKACSVYRGDLFEDDPYSDWCRADREYLRQRYFDAVRRLARLCFDVGEVERSIEYYRQALRLDNLREDLHQGLIMGLLSLGHRNGALQQYHECAALLRSELDVDPLPETRRLYGRILESLQG